MIHPVVGLCCGVKDVMLTPPRTVVIDCCDPRFVSSPLSYGRQLPPLSWAVDHSSEVDMWVQEQGLYLLKSARPAYGILGTSTFSLKYACNVNGTSEQYAGYF